MIDLTLKQVAQWTGGTVDPEFENVMVFGVTTDSRTAKVGDLFVPLVGENMDGHSYISSAMLNCAATLSDRPLDDEEIPVVLVPDTLKAYGDLARHYREELGIMVVGITGSVGKTTTKEMIAAVIEKGFRVAKTDGNFNNHIGLPQTVLGIEEDCQCAILEMGMNHFGEMSYLTGIAKPNVAVITNIGTAHIEHLGSREGILKAKLEIMEGLAPNGILVLNGDEPLLWNLKGTLPFKTVYFGMDNPECDVLARDLVPSKDGITFYVEGLRAEFEVFVPVPGRHTVYNALAALTMGIMMEISPSKMQYALANFQNTGMRQKIYEENGMTIIEDCYNAGPESMEAALNVLAEYKCSGRRIAVLGDMLELGNCSMAEHYKVGRQVATCTDLFFAYGSNAERMVTGAITGGMSANCVFHFDSHEQMAKMLKNRARAGDLLLFKGSRGMRMEHVLHLFLGKE